MDETLIGYAKCSTDDQDLTDQRYALVALDVAPDRIELGAKVSDAGPQPDAPGRRAPGWAQL